MSRSISEIWQDVRTAYNMREATVLSDLKSELHDSTESTSDGWAVIVEGWIEQADNRTPEALVHYQRALDFFEATSDYAGLAYAKREYNRYLSSDDGGESKIEAFKECIELFQTAGDLQGELYTTSILCGDLLFK